MHILSFVSFYKGEHPNVKSWFEKNVYPIYRDEELTENLYSIEILENLKNEEISEDDVPLYIKDFMEKVDRECPGNTAYVRFMEI